MSQRTFNRFDYFEPKTLTETTSLLAKFGQKGRVVAGGTDLFVLIRNQVIAPEYVIGISKIPNMDAVVDQEKGLKIGALATIRAIETSPIILEKFAALGEAAHALGSTHVRNTATVGGNLCRAAPSAELACPLLVLDAELTVVGPTGKRVVPIDSFFTGPGQTALRKDEILTEINLPKLPQNAGTAFLKVSRTAIDLAQVNAAVALTIVNGVCKDVKIALGAVAPTPIRAKKAEEALKGKTIKTGEEKIIEEIAKIASEETKPISDVRATAEYRQTVSGVLAKRAIKIALGRVK